MGVAYNLKKIQGAKTRDELLAAGIKVFAERGYHRARLEDIAAAAGTTRGALYWHFADKEDFLVALLERIIEHSNKGTIDQIPMCGDAAELLAASLVGHAEMTLRVPWLPRLIITVGLDAESISPRIWKLIRRSREPNHYLMARIIKYGQETGVFRSDIDADQVGVVLAVVRTGLVACWQIDPDVFDLRRTTKAFIATLLPSLFSEKAVGRKIAVPKAKPKEIDAAVAQMLKNYGMVTDRSGVKGITRNPPKFRPSPLGKFPKKAKFAHLVTAGIANRDSREVNRKRRER